jgi:hypothetical protein
VQDRRDNVKSIALIIMEDRNDNNNEQQNATYILTPDEFLEIGLKLVNYKEETLLGMVLWKDHD